MPASQPQSGDDVTTLLKKVLANQSGSEVAKSGDGERDTWRKILLNQADQVDLTATWTT